MTTKYFLIIFLSLITASYAAQIDSIAPIPSIKSSNPSDTSKIMLGKTQVIIISKSENSSDTLEIEEEEKEEEKDWALVGLFNFGTSGYLHNNLIGLPTEYQQMELDTKRSKSLGFDFMIKGIDLFKKRMYFSPGIGLDWNQYHFKDKQLSISTQNDTVAFLSDSTITFDKYKLRTAYLQVPVLIGFRLGNFDKKVVNIQLGAIAAYNIGAITKAKYSIKGTKYNNKIKDDYNINPFKLDAIARVSFGDVGLFGRYSFTSLFEKNKAPTVTPFSVGLTFGSL